MLNIILKYVHHSFFYFMLVISSCKGIEISLKNAHAIISTTTQNSTPPSFSKQQ
jgi:hypothetical protein